MTEAVEGDLKTLQTMVAVLQCDVTFVCPERDREISKTEAARWIFRRFAALARAEAEEGLTKRAMVRLMGEIVQAADDVLNDPAKQDFRRLSDLRASCLSRASHMDGEQNER